MVLYRRSRIANAPFFLTVTLADRSSNLLTENIGLLRVAFKETQKSHPFQTIAIVVMPEHFHWVCTLPEGNADFSNRIRLIKRGFTMRLLESGYALARYPNGGYKLWQRRFWEHTILDNDDLQTHVDYIHFNPVKHGLVDRVKDWPYSSFHRYVRDGLLPEDWGGISNTASSFSYGEP